MEVLALCGHFEEVPREEKILWPFVFNEMLDYFNSPSDIYWTILSHPPK
jgi:hypothetical protein